jgi:hypothetical protein
MSYGFLALNDDNDVLISSDTKNLHFAGKATKPTSAAFSFTNHGQHQELHYTITFPNRTSIPVPFFTILHGSAGIAGVTGVNSGSSSKTWTIKIIKSGVIQSTGGFNDFIPEVYVFTDPSAIPASGNYGFQVFNSDGTTSFDSRLRPLTVTHVGSALQPSNPLSSASAVTLSGDECADINNNAFTPTQYNIANFGTVGWPRQGGTSNGAYTPMYHYNALPQVQREVSFAVTSNDCTGFGIYGECLGYNVSTTSQSTYWCFYRGGIGFHHRTGNVNKMRVGWIPCQSGCHWVTSSNALFLALFGPGNSSVSGGAWPYTDETINLTAQNVIVANHSLYD